MTCSSHGSDIKHFQSIELRRNKSHSHVLFLFPHVAILPNLETDIGGAKQYMY
jgi:hypothetical protein